MLREKWNISLDGVPLDQGKGTPTNRREMPPCNAGTVPKSSSGPPCGASWVTLTNKEAQAARGVSTSVHLLLTSVYL